MKQYRNAQRTKKWIRRAFTELIAEKKSIDKITVGELAERADITKTTFYYHYDDLYAVVEEIENELTDNLTETLKQIASANPCDYPKYIEKMLAFIKENEDSYRLVVNASEMTYFSDKLKSVFSKEIVAMANVFGFSQDYEKRAVQVYFLVSACADTVIRYLKGELTSSIDLVGEVIIEAVYSLMNRQ